MLWKPDWKFLERIHIALGIPASVVALVAVVASIWTAIERIYWPAWLAILIAAITLIGGFLLGKRVGGLRSRHLNEPVALRRIDFKYPDGPTDHGWRITQDSAVHPARIDFEQYVDPTVGKSVKITAEKGARAEIDTDPPQYLASSFLVRYNPCCDAAFYARLNVAGKGNPFFLNYQIGRQQPKKSTTDEWVVYVQPEQIADGWLQIQRDISADFSNTFAHDGFRLDRISGFRIRGTLGLESITLLK